MIQISNISKNFGELQVLKNINLEIFKGEVVSIIGASGAGKTTLLQIMGTLLSADDGEILIDNTNINQLTQKSLARFRNLNIGFVFQFHQLLPEFSAFENVCIPGFIARRNKSEVEKEAKRLLDFLNLNHRHHHKPSELSGGEQQRVAVARALINNPSIVLADEPSGNLDSHNKTELHQLFFELRDQFKQTIVIVTHDNDLAHMADRMLVMQDGIFV